jgi:hypothetical protein
MRLHDGTRAAVHWSGNDKCLVLMKRMPLQINKTSHISEIPACEQ